MAKVHLYQHVPSAWNAFNDGTVERNVATNQTKCGYVRERVTKDKSLVTCAHCLRAMKEKGEIVTMAGLIFKLVMAVSDTETDERTFTKISELRKCIQFNLRRNFDVEVWEGDTNLITLPKVCYWKHGKEGAHPTLNQMLNDH